MGVPLLVTPTDPGGSQNDPARTTLRPPAAGCGSGSAGTSGSAGGCDQGSLSGVGWGGGSTGGLGVGFGAGAGMGAGAAGCGNATGAGVGCGNATGAGVGVVTETSGVDGVVVGDGTTMSVEVGLPVDETIGALTAVGSAADGAVAPTTTKVAIDPTAEAGTTTLAGRRRAVGSACRGRAKPDSHTATATQSVIGQNSIAATPTGIPEYSRARSPGKRLANSVAMITAVSNATTA